MVSTFDTINSKIKTRKLIPSYFRNSKVVNTSNDFFDEKNFVGYILPDGNMDIIFFV